ncbi:MAG: cysteine peptidase family C39 domain-containing protein [Brevundimonas sp.]|nr:cysteine peptidase family C39 domain-containing protein [Brevundimonas sp.]MCH4270027.1 cysteine peptidase family C39 domain-containing protein [Brevundimonas sp.]
MSAARQAGATPAADSGLSCLTTLLAFHQIPSDQAQLRHALGHGRSADDSDLVLLAKRMEAKARAVTLELKGLERAPLPAIGKDRSGDYFIIGAIRDGQVLIQRPGAAPTAVTLSEFEQVAGPFWSRRACLLRRRPGSTSPGSFRLSSSTAGCWATCWRPRWRCNSSPSRRP